MHKAFDRFFRDKDGKVVLAQSPNLPKLVWLASLCLQLVIKTGTMATVLEYISITALAVWAGLELFKGDTYFRKTLGLIVLLGMAYTRLR